jgi:hypothetical protein
MAAFVFFTAINAQTEKPNHEKDIAGNKKQESLLTKEIRKDRKELRELEGKEVSNQAKLQFIREFGNIPEAKWERGTHFDMVTYTKNAKEFVSYYDEDANLVGTIAVRSFTDLPSNAQIFINEKYKDYRKEKVLYYDDNEKNETDMVLYNKQFDDEDNYFVVLKKENKEIILQVNRDGYVYFFTSL